MNDILVTTNMTLLDPKNAEAMQMAGNRIIVEKNLDVFVATMLRHLLKEEEEVDEQTSFRMADAFCAGVGFARLVSFVNMS